VTDRVGCYDTRPRAPLNGLICRHSTAAALTTLGLAAASWVVALRQMNGMDMGVAAELGSFAFFVAL
jgi:hypothetical protein